MVILFEDVAVADTFEGATLGLVPELDDPVSTVTAQVAVLFPSTVLTVIVADPADTAETVPPDTVATEELLVAQLTLLFVALLGLTVAVRVSDPPTVKARLVLLRLTLLTDTLEVAELTVTEQVAIFPPSTVLTVIVADPADTAETVPPDTVATEVLLVAQLTFLFVALLGLTVAVRVSDPPTVKDRLVLLRLTLLTDMVEVAELTVTEQVAIFPPSTVLTVIVAVPAEIAETVPPDTVATEELLVAQLTLLFVALLGLTVAVRVSEPSTVKERLVLLRVTPVTDTAEGATASHLA